MAAAEEPQRGMELRRTAAGHSLEVEVKELEVQLAGENPEAEVA